MKALCIILGLWVSIESTLALSCFPCTGEETCPEHDCSYGTYREACACCDVCAKGPDETCGGLWYSKGKCGDGLTCVPVPGTKVGDIDTFPGLDVLDGRCQNSTTTDWSTVALDCAGCTGQEICANEDCPSGVYRPPCECCDVCAKGISDTCGGYWLALGKCGDGLACFPVPGSQVGDMDTIAGLDVTDGKCQSLSDIDWSATSIHCSPCADEQKEFCSASASSCPYGMYRPPCACCDECAKGPEETCGGVELEYGKCGGGLTCVPAPGAEVGDLDIIPGHDISKGMCQNSTAV